MAWAAFARQRPRTWRIDDFELLFIAALAIFFVGYTGRPMWRFFGYALSNYARGLLLALAWLFAIG